MKWINIKDRLPEEGARILVYGYWCGEINGDDDEKTIGLADYKKRSFEGVGSDAYSVWYKNVSHWMATEEPN